MQTDSVRITLLEPWAFERDGSERPVVVRHGTHPARPIAQNSGLPGENVADWVDAGSFQDQQPRRLARYVPGAPVSWEFMHSDPDKNELVVPIESAMLWFGDWRRPKVAAPGTPAEMTYGFERNRVAARWGWWKMPSTVQGFAHLQGGNMRPDVSRVGSVQMPKVRIEDVDNKGRTTGSLCYLPHEYFDFDADIVGELMAAPGAPPALVIGSGLDSLNVSEIRRLLAVAEAMEAAEAAKHAPTKLEKK